MGPHSIETVYEWGGKLTFPVTLEGEQEFREMERAVRKFFIPPSGNRHERRAAAARHRKTYGK